MFFFITGARPRKRAFEGAQSRILWCPMCGTNRAFEEKRIRNYIELFFIPIIPLGSERRVYSCEHCDFDVAPDRLGSFPRRPGETAPPGREIRPEEFKVVGGPNAPFSEETSKDLGRGQPTHVYCVYCGSKVPAETGRGLQYLRCSVCERRFEVNLED